MSLAKSREDEKRRANWIRRNEARALMSDSERSLSINEICFYAICVASFLLIATCIVEFVVSSVGRKEGESAAAAA